MAVWRRRARAERATGTDRRGDLLDRLLVEVGDERAFCDADEQKMRLRHAGRVERGDDGLVLRFGRARRGGRTLRARSELLAERGGFFLDSVEAGDQARAARLMLFEVGASRLRTTEGKVAAPAGER